ncbi:hypothetical protein Pcinc_036642, partial [Petrolisthes cinctipes]
PCPPTTNAPTDQWRFTITTTHNHASTLAPTLTPTLQHTDHSYQLAAKTSPTGPTPPSAPPPPTTHLPHG